MNARVRSFEGRQHDAITARRSAAAEADIERIRHALAHRFAVLEPRKSDPEIELYLARDILGKTVQLKVLSKRAAGDARARELFYLSARAASRLEHMNILAISNAEQANGVDFCVGEHKQDARTLRESLDSNGWLEMNVAARMADQIASALDHAHQTGVLHLRLQPECVLIEPDGWVTIADFGIEAKLGSLRSPGPLAPYASPEQLLGTTLDHRSDLYSLGAILYEMLTDRTPFDSNDQDYVRQKQESFAPSPPHLISMDVPEPVSSVVMKLLEREPENRFKSAAAFQEALDNAMGEL
jgi:eukaryotic-like serine/threonine-protein kinase